MKYLIIDGILYEDGQCSNIQASFAEEEFWARIEELEDSLAFWKKETQNQDAAIFKYEERIRELEITLTEIFTRTLRPSKREGGAAQIVLSAEQMAEIAEKALIK
jgi:hypothetical protein